MRIFDWGKKRRSFDSVALDRTGRTLAAGGNYQTTVVWDAVSGAERVRLADFAYALQFHPLDGRLFLSTRDGLRAYDSTSGVIAVSIPDAQYGVAPPAFAPNEDWAVCLRRFKDQPSTLTAVARFGFPNRNPSAF